ncbi:hypothetical protein HJC23_013170 [Cyclotella cryptica]|uniref:Amino acid transporter transmembrane domain-containing protein n=1 Tax=Cyclotella cryptica TaxID=29204 RepID=A0ABD3QN48_9STRA|eukprot:CCRYP_003989-RD/>CCRYP_003989-RD protein AED:0.06 eAED:0.06 QI:190/1/1/1/0.25/0.6/5/370/609
MKKKTALPPKSPFLAPRRVSSKDILSSGSFSDNDYELDSPFNIPTPSINSNTHPIVEPEHKSTLVGCTANLITAIVGAGIIGIPYAMKETGLVAGTLLILISGALGCKSLRLLVETAKHVDAPSYEILCESTFGSAGWAICNVNMFMMSWGPMLSYMMIVKDTAGNVLGFEDERAHKMVLVVTSVLVMLPLSLQRDMADLAKTSRICVLFDVFLVAIIAWFSPTSESISTYNGILPILSNSTFRPQTCFIGLGILSFAFSCQHSSLIIAGSLKNPTRDRWKIVTASALGICSILAIFMGSFGYLGFLERTEGDIFNNFPLPSAVTDPNDLFTAKAINVARGVLCCIMFFVYPLESFVARHVIMTNLFRGRDAHEGDDHVVLDRWDRRVATTIILFLSILITALNYSDVGLVLAWTGTVAATSLAYVLPGILFIGVHGQEFLDLVESRWGCTSILHSSAYHFTMYDYIMWYMLLIPVWCWFASLGKASLTFYNEKKALQTPAQSYRLGKIKHKNLAAMQQQFLRGQQLSRDDSGTATTETASFGKSAGLLICEQTTKKYGSMPSNVEEEDPQDERQATSDFLVAIGFVIFGIVALSSGILSIMCATAGYD